jgi:hypothetical protein
VEFDYMMGRFTRQPEIGGGVRCTMLGIEWRSAAPLQALAPGSRTNENVLAKNSRPGTSIGEMAI